MSQSSKFSFPPPPPPPPRAASQDYSAPQNYSNNDPCQRGGRRNGGLRIDRGYFRGLGGGSGGAYGRGSFNIGDRNGGQNDMRSQHDSRPNYDAFPQGQKRPYSAIASRSPRPTAPPATPSFGFQLQLPIAVSPPDPPSDAKAKKPRTHNVLGLTPRTEEHESSEEEGMDEEAKLASSLGNAASKAAEGLQIFHKGKLSVLKSKEDIAAWIEERKKRYPTRAKAEQNALLKAKTKQLQEAAAAKQREEARKQQEARKAAAKELTEKRKEQEAKRAEAKESSGQKSSAKVNVKAEKLQKRLDKALAKVAQLEAKKSAKAVTDVAPTFDIDSVTKEEVLDEDVIDSDPDTDDTSSSGTSSDGEDEPIEVSIKPDWPVQMPPPKREPPKRDNKERGICRNFLNMGRCQRGRSCRYKHELPNRGQASKAASTSESNPRMSLHERLLLRQQEEENEQILQHIVYLGEQGVLDEPQV